MVVTSQYYSKCECEDWHPSLLQYGGQSECGPSEEFTELVGVYTSREAAVHNAMVAMENIYGKKVFYEDGELIVEEDEDIEDNKDNPYSIPPLPTILHTYPTYHPPYLPYLPYSLPPLPSPLSLPPSLIAIASGLMNSMEIVYKQDALKAALSDILG